MNSFLSTADICETWSFADAKPQLMPDVLNGKPCEATVAKRRCPTTFPHGEHEVWSVFSIRVLLVGELRQFCTAFALQHL